jgi:hypothetical protein
MCPLCRDDDDQACLVTELPNGRLICACGRHSWPNSAALLETCRQQSLTITGMPQIWTQGY